MQIRASANLQDANALTATAPVWKVYGRLLRYAWDYRFRFLTSILFALFASACFSGMIVSVGAAVRVVYGDQQEVQRQIDSAAARIDRALGNVERMVGWGPQGAGDSLKRLAEGMRTDRGTALAALSSALVALAVIGGFSRMVQEFNAGIIGVSITVRLIQEMFENVMRMPLAFFEKRTTGEIIARFTNDVFMVNRGLANIFVKAMREPIRAAMCFAVAFSVDWKLTMMAVVVFPPIAYAIYRIGREVKKRMRRSLQHIASMASVVSETVRGIQIVKAFQMEKHEIRRVRTDLKKLRRHLRAMVRADAMVPPITQTLMIIGFVLFLYAGNHAVEARQIDSGALVVLAGSLFAMIDPMLRLAQVNNQLQVSVASAERVLEFIDAKPDIVEQADAKALPPLKGTLRFDNVRFSYNGSDEVLSGVTFEVDRGQMAALVGFSGAGKSTIAKLIPRFYDVTGGRITIDGIDIRDVTMRSLRDQISVVTQESILFNETVSENISFGRTDFSRDKIMGAAAAAQAAEFIERLPNLYDTLLAEAGGSLSGGQRQRLAIARAIIKDPAILILDEATSSLDSESERAIQKAIEESVVGRTTIVIAHRLSTVRRADVILVVDDGRIVEQGRHDELIAKGGLYKRLYETQFASQTEEIEQ